MTLELVKLYAVIISAVASIISSAVILIKPLRDRVFCISDIISGVKCMLRAEMLRTYYKRRERKQLRQYERQNFIFEYRAYKALGGNSFIDDIFDKVSKWDIVS